MGRCSTPFNKKIKTSIMFSLTQSASFASTKVSAAAPKQSTKRSPFKGPAKAINSESLSTRDCLSAAILSFGFLSVGDADAALRIVTNNKMVAGWKPDRVKASFDAWVERCESRDEALDLVSKNPGLLFCKPSDVKDSPLGQAKMIAGAMDFFRFGK